MLARDKPSGSSTRSRAAGSVAGNHAREAPAGGQSARSRKPSVKGLASCGSPVSSGERGLIAAASAYLCSLFERINPHQLPSRNRTSSLHDRHRGRSTRCEGGMRTVGGGSSTQSTPCPPPRRLFALRRGIQSDCPACFFVRPWHRNLVLTRRTLLGARFVPL